LPQIFRDCVAALKRSGKSDDSSYAICTANFMKTHGMTPVEAEKRGKLDDELLEQKLCVMDKLLNSLSEEDIAILTDEDEYELAELFNTSVDGLAISLVWAAPTKRKDVPEGHFFNPAEKKYPYRSPDGSINCDGVMAAWKMAHGARSGKPNPDMISKIKPKYDACMKKKSATDVQEYIRQFDMPDKVCMTVSPSLMLDETQEDASKEIEIQVLKVGKFEHPDYGMLEFTPKTFETFIKNFENKVPQEHIAYDFRHRPDWGAAAWLRNLFTKEDGLWAKVELTKRGYESLKDKEFLYFSTEYVDDYVDKSDGKKFGPTILGGGLTNRPFIKGMAPAILSQDGEIVTSPVGDNSNTKKEEEQIMMTEILTQLKALNDQLVKLAEGKDAEETKKFAEALQGQIKVLEDKAKELEGKEDPKVKLLEDAKAKLEGEVKVLTDTMTTLLEKNEKDNRRIYEQDVSAFGKELEDKGLWPATVAVVKDLMLATPNEKHVAITLSEKVEGQDQPKETKLSLRDIFAKLLESIPADVLIDEGERSAQHMRRDETKGAMTVAEIEKYADENKLSFKDAIVKLSVDGKLTV